MPVTHQISSYLGSEGGLVGILLPELLVAVEAFASVVVAQHIQVRAIFLLLFLFILLFLLLHLQGLRVVVMIRSGGRPGIIGEGSETPPADAVAKQHVARHHRGGRRRRPYFGSV